MSKKPNFLFGPKNYIILCFSIVLIAIGFILMTGGGGATDSDFNPDIFSVKRIRISPVVILLGYIGAIFSIFYND